jgi:hypothetical protein
MKQLRITVGHKTYDVTVEVLKDTDSRPGTGIPYRRRSFRLVVSPDFSGTVHETASGFRL